MHELDADTSDAGRGLGGIYGKGPAQAITPDNQVAELYDPAVLQVKTARQSRVWFPGILKAVVLDREAGDGAAWNGRHEIIGEL
jgi:hypothetical protein